MKSILVTSGGTEIPIDPVRSIKNRSRGTTGASLTNALLEQNNFVYLLRARHSAVPKDFRTGIDFYEAEYTTFDEYHIKLLYLLNSRKFDAVVLAAAVSDYGVVPTETKIRSDDDLSIKMFKLPKLIKKVKEIQPETFLVGFKMLVGASQEELIEESFKSIRENKCNIVVGNNWKQSEAVMVDDVRRITPLTFENRVERIVGAIECGISS